MSQGQGVSKRPKGIGEFEARAFCPGIMQDLRTWLGIINDLRTALLRDPLPLDVVKELVGQAA